MQFLTSLLFSLVLFLQHISFTAARPLVPRHSSEFATHTVYQFANGTWAENIAVRPNGNLLVTRIDVPELYELDPSASNSTPELVYRFPKAQTLFGIAESSPDRFAVLAGNFSFDTGSQKGSYSVWNVDFSSSNESIGAAPQVSKVVDLTEGEFLNGVSSLSNDTVLVGDLEAGVIYGVNVNTGTYYLASKDPVLAPAPNPVLGEVGVNGIHVRGNYLYFVTSGTNVFGRFRIGPDGVQVGEASVIAQRPNATLGFDDFTYDSHGNFYLVTVGGNSVEQVNLNGQSRIIAGSLNSTAIAQPTAAHLGRGANDKNVLYVTTAGGLAFPVNGNTIVGAQVVAVDLGKEAC